MKSMRTPNVAITDSEVRESNRRSTDKQKRAVLFVEDVLKITFRGDLDNKRTVSKFLNKFLLKAKEEYSEMAGDYLSFTADKDWA